MSRQGLAKTLSFKYRNTPVKYLPKKPLPPLIKIVLPDRRGAWPMMPDTIVFMSSAMIGEDTIALGDLARRNRDKVAVCAAGFLFDIGEVFVRKDNQNINRLPTQVLFWENWDMHTGAEFMLFERAVVDYIFDKFVPEGCDGFINCAFKLLQPGRS